MRRILCKTINVGIHLCFQRLTLYPASSSIDSSFAYYLVHSPGVFHNRAFSTSDSVAGFFKTHGFDDTLFRNIVSFNPTLLSCNVDKTLKPKFHFFRNQRFSQSDIIRVISANPDILLADLESSIVPGVEIFRQVLVHNSSVINALMNLGHWPYLHIVDNLRPNLDLLSSYRIPTELIRELFVMKPVAFLQKPEDFKDTVSRVEQRLGICDVFELFLYSILRDSSTNGDNYYSKMRLFMSFGWTDSDIEGFAESGFNDVFSLSCETIKQRLEFLMNELRLEPAYLTKYPKLYNSDMKKLWPRHKVLLTLKEKGIIERYPSVANTVLSMSEPHFLKRYVIPYKEVHQVYEQHTGRSIKTVLRRQEVLLILKEKGLTEIYPLGFVLDMPEPCFLEEFVIPYKEVQEVYAQLTGCSMKMLTEESVDIVS